MPPEEVTLEVLALPGLTPVLSDSIAICTTYQYDLDPGGYRVRGTYLDTGEVLESDVTITEGVVSPVDLYFEAPPAVEYDLIITATAGGTTNPAPGTYTAPEGTLVTVTAIPDTGFNFDRWALDGVTYTTNPINVLMDRSYALQAVFSEEPPPPPETYNLTTASTIGGDVDPPPGVYTYDEGTVVTVTAYPDAGYVFDHWEIDGVVSKENPTDVTMNSDQVIVAVFSPPTPPVRPGVKIALAATGAVALVAVVGAALVKRR